MELPEDDVDTFELFIQWLYKQRYELPEAPLEPTVDKTCWSYLEWPVKLLVLSEKYHISKLKLNVIEALLAYINMKDEFCPHVPPQPCVEYAYNNTNRGSGIRRLLADWYAQSLNSEWFTDQGTRDWLIDIPEFAIDLLIVISKFVSDSMTENYFHNVLPAQYMCMEGAQSRCLCLNGPQQLTLTLFQDIIILLQRYCTYDPERQRVASESIRVFMLITSNNDTNVEDLCFQISGPEPHWARRCMVCK